MAARKKAGTKPKKSPRKEEAYANKYKRGARPGKTLAGGFLNESSSSEAKHTASANREFRKALNEIGKPGGGRSPVMEKFRFGFDSESADRSKKHKERLNKTVKKNRLSKKERDYVKSQRKK